MSTETIFDLGSTTISSQQDNQIPQTSLPTEVVEFVGEGKKYGTVEEALKSVPHAQKHIQSLEAELAQLKEQVTKQKTTEELLDELKSGLNTNEATTTTVGLDKDELTNLVNQTLAQREAQQTSKQNASSVASKFREKFGDAAEQAYITLAQESGLSVQQLNNLAATSPSAVLRLAGLSAGGSGMAGKSSSSVNTEALSNTAVEEKSARVKQGATTKDLVNAWKIAGEKVKANLST